MQQDPSQQPQPMYAQQPPAKPRKKLSRGCLIGSIIIGALLVIGIASVANGGSKGTTSNTAPSPTQAPPSAHKTGEVVTIGGWQVVVNGVTTSTGDSLFHPKAGNTFVLIDVTVTNATAQSQSLSSLISFAMKDSTGQKYAETIVPSAPSTPDGNVAAGAKLRGTLAYEIASSFHTIELDFTPDLASTDVATWNLSVP